MNRSWGKQCKGKSEHRFWNFGLETFAKQYLLQISQSCQ